MKGFFFLYNLVFSMNIVYNVNYSRYLVFFYELDDVVRMNLKYFYMCFCNYDFDFCDLLNFVRKDIIEEVF